MDGAENISSVRYACVKTHLQGLRINSLIASESEDFEALAKIYKSILMLSNECPTSHHGDARRIAFL